jgi:hypothetical protein
MKSRDGRTFPVEINANYFESQGASHNFGLVRDITERKAVERERLANLQFFESMDKVNRAILALPPEQVEWGDQSGMGMAIYPKNSDAWGSH